MQAVAVGVENCNAHSSVQYAAAVHMWSRDQIDNPVARLFLRLLCRLESNIMDRAEGDHQVCGTVGDHQVCVSNYTIFHGLLESRKLR
jgi:hypothetical protein